MPELRDEPNVCTFSADGSKLTAYDIFPPDLGGRSVKTVNKEYFGGRKMKGQKFLKVTGILMIIGAALSILFGVIIGGVGVLVAKVAGASTLGFAFYLGLATTLVGGIIQLIAGINGVKHCNKPENAKKCITWGIIVIALAVISSVLQVIGGGKFNVLSFVIGLIIPGLYIYGAFLNHKENAR